MSICVEPSRIMFGVCTLADMKLFHLFPRHLFVDKGGGGGWGGFVELNHRFSQRGWVLKSEVLQNADVNVRFQEVKLKIQLTNTRFFFCLTPKNSKTRLFGSSNLK